MGGLISLYAFLRHPRVFGFCGAMSPSLWFADRAIFDVARDVPRWFGRVYLDIGTEEGQRHVRDTRQMCRLLRSRCPFPRDQLLCVVDEGAHHNEQAWAARFETAARFLVPNRKGDIHW
jgi:predicted alpha/beta superfamily hydrolase